MDAVHCTVACCGHRRAPSGVPGHAALVLYWSTSSPAPTKQRHPASSPVSAALPAQVTQATALEGDYLHPALPPSVIKHLKDAEANLDHKVDVAIDHINGLSHEATHSPYPALPPAVVTHLNNFENNLTAHVDVVVNHLAALDSKVDLPAPAPAPTLYRRMRI